MNTCVRIGRLNIVKMPVIPKLIYRYNASPIKTPARLFHRCKKVYFKFICKGTGPWIAKTTLTKKNKVGGLSLPYIKPYDTTILIKIVRDGGGWTCRSMKQNREPRNRPPKTGPSNFLQRCKSNLIEEKQSFQQMVLEQLNIQNKKINFNLNLRP